MDPREERPRRGSAGLRDLLAGALTPHPAAAFECCSSGAPPCCRLLESREGTLPPGTPRATGARHPGSHAATHRPCQPCQRKGGLGLSPCLSPWRVRAKRASPEAPGAQICHLVLPAVLTPVFCSGSEAAAVSLPCPHSLTLPQAPCQSSGGEGTTGVGSLRLASPSPCPQHNWQR